MTNLCPVCCTDDELTEIPPLYNTVSYTVYMVHNTCAFRALHHFFCVTNWRHLWSECQQCVISCHSISPPWWTIWGSLSYPTIPGLALIAWRYFHVTTDIHDTIILCKLSTKSANEYLQSSDRCIKYYWKRETYRGQHVKNGCLSHADRLPRFFDRMV